MAGVTIDTILSTVIGLLLGGIVVGMLRYALAFALPRTASSGFDRRLVGVAVIGLFAVIVASSYGVPAAIRTDRLVVAIVSGATVLTGTIVGFAAGGSAGDGASHGLAAAGGAGVLYVFVAAHRSFATQPALTMIVVLSGVIAPTVLGILGCAGGAVGASARRTIAARTAPRHDRE